MELINSIFVYFTDKTKKFSHKTVIILFSLMLLVVVDNTLSFTYNYNTTNKIDQIQKLNMIVSDTTLANSEIDDLKVLRNDILNHKTWKDQLYNKIVAIDFKSKDGNKPVVKSDIPKMVNERNYWYHFISSSWILFIIMVIIPFVGIFDKKTSFGSTIMALIFFIAPIFYGFSWLFAKLFSFIPVISNNPNINYIVNAILHLLSFLLIGFLAKKFDKKKTNNISF